jgi:uncharacterized protein (DUF362 family)
MPTNAEQPRLASHQVTLLRHLAAAQSADFLAQDPGEPFPEYRFGSYAHANPVYSAVRQLFASMGLDVRNYGRASWNPLGAIIRPGSRVLVKPNLVFHKHYRQGSIHWVITDPRLVRAVCDYVLLAIGKEGELVIGDAPLQSADWERLLHNSGLETLPERYRERGYRVELRDFRTMQSVDVRGLKCRPRKLPGDPAGYRRVDLGIESHHAGRDWRRYRVTNYDPSAMQGHHNDRNHEYLIAGSALDADVVINLPKLKTHRKAGLTGPLKNMVGVNGCKDWLPHHSKGSVASGGDEFAAKSSWKQLSSWIVEREESSTNSTSKLLWNAFRRIVWRTSSPFALDRTWEGSWHGNDTLWRTIADLNRIVLYADRYGVMQSSPQRTLLTITDAIVAGEGDGPMSPDPVPMGLLMASLHPLASEIAAVKLAQWPVETMKLLQGAVGERRYSLNPGNLERIDLKCVDLQDSSVRTIPWQRASRFLKPPANWHVARTGDEMPAADRLEVFHHAG